MFFTSINSSISLLANAQQKWVITTKQHGLCTTLIRISFDCMYVVRLYECKVKKWKDMWWVDICTFTTFSKFLGHNICKWLFYSAIWLYCLGIPKWRLIFHPNNIWHCISYQVTIFTAHIFIAVMKTCLSWLSLKPEITEGLMSVLMGSSLCHC